ncbi:hypothetical protein GE061_011490 [Apolygus lucorum]|uniref:Uncharacterized protein n=1 Tax=Apolygus lucorum TaxID=248454 RepID=A0A8S9XZQ3_APOLU|nr:hypothetical protein GE061_011490 [Apolygus lucorum]
MKIALIILSAFFVGALSQPDGRFAQPGYKGDVQAPSEPFVVRLFKGFIEKLRKIVVFFHNLIFVHILGKVKGVAQHLRSMVG